MKDKVTRKNRLLTWEERHKCIDISRSHHYGDALYDQDKLLQAQAEISFKAGYDHAEAGFKLKFNPDYLDFQKGVEAGRKEVVGWIKSKSEIDNLLMRRLSIHVIEWQAKLKEWGIET